MNWSTMKSAKISIICGENFCKSVANVFLLLTPIAIGITFLLLSRSWIFKCLITNMRLCEKKYSLSKLLITYRYSALNFLPVKDLKRNPLVYNIISGVLTRSCILKSLTGFTFYKSLINSPKKLRKKIYPVKVLVTNWYSMLNFQPDRI